MGRVEVKAGPRDHLSGRSLPVREDGAVHALHRGKDQAARRCGVDLGAGGGGEGGGRGGELGHASVDGESGER